MMCHWIPIAYIPTFGGAGLTGRPIAYQPLFGAGGTDGIGRPIDYIPVV